jgi:hypothetical protein
VSKKTSTAPPLDHLIERRRELDRLYMLSDNASRAASRCGSPAEKEILTRKANRYWRLYQSLKNKE